MKQLLQSLSNGKTLLQEVPKPKNKNGNILIETRKTLISSGTERMLVKFGKSNALMKAKQQPEKVRQVLEKVKTDGLINTYDAVKSKLDQPIPLGYCNVGKAVDAAVDFDTHGIKRNDRVVSNGYHAEYVSVPANLCAVIPKNVSDECAAFTVLGAIGLQGVRLADPKIGENVAVFGMGLIGLLTVQILKAQGCRVLAIDISNERLKIAQTFGAETFNTQESDALNSITSLMTDGAGFDAVLITASTEDNQIISQAAQISRKRGKIVLTGVVGLNINRSDFYEKEITFQVSCSYGPGRYDPKYEDLGRDYPIGFVRWTEKRNFEAILFLMSEGKIVVDNLISHQFLFDDSHKAMNLLTSKEKSLGILLNYKKAEETTSVDTNAIKIYEDKILNSLQSSGVVGFLGSGNYAGRVLIPAFAKAGATLHTCVSAGGYSSAFYGKKFGFRFAATDSSEITKNSEIDAVVIATRHNSHADQVLDSLRAGKHVFCEKPLCLKTSELAEIEKEARRRPKQILMVGFNRRFSPLVLKARTLLNQESSSKNIVITVNAGFISQDHWIQDPNVGGGRLIGEACHFIDLARYLVGSKIKNKNVYFSSDAVNGSEISDQVSILLKFEDGSVASINYLSSGHKSYPKEKVEIFVSGKILEITNFRVLKGYGWKKFKRTKLWKQDKGQAECSHQFIQAIKQGNGSPIPLDEVIETSRVIIEIAEKYNG